MTFREVIAYTRKSRSTINRAVAGGSLLKSQTGGPNGHRLFKLADVEAWMRGERPAVRRRRGPRPANAA